MNIRIERYQPGLQTAWDLFVQQAKNGLFLFERSYMDYHADRFTDHSLLFYKGNSLLAVLPANEKNENFISHGGLTFGGLILAKSVFLKDAVAIFEAMLQYLKSAGFSTMVYKAIPTIFHVLPAQEDLYLLFRNGATLIKRDVNSVIDLSSEIKYTKGVNHNLAKARQQNLVIKESSDFETFMQIEGEILQAKYQTKPTHSALEIALLASRFPEQIKLYLVYKNEVCLGGSIIYIYEQVIHTQYSGFTEAGKATGAFAFLTDHLIKQFTGRKKYFSFGISTQHNDDYLNEGLVFSKESFMARTMVHDTYSLNLL